MQASPRILQVMASEDNASMSDVMDYIGYITKIATLVQSFRWESVLRFEYKYRKAQARLCFPCGADSAYLMQLHHVASVNMPTVDAAVKPRMTGIPPKSRNKFDPNSGTIICQRFNGRQGCQLKAANMPMSVPPASNPMLKFPIR